MVIHLHHAGDHRFWRAELDEDGVLFIVEGRIGSPGEPTRVIEDGEEPTPNEYLMEELADEMVGQGYTEVVPSDIVDIIERGHDVILFGRLRDFYQQREFESVRGSNCRRLACRVDFTALCVRGRWSQGDYIDPATKEARRLIPISSKTNADGYVDEQQWIGIDPLQPDGAIYSLYTSGQFEPAYPSLDGLLADLD